MKKIGLGKTGLLVSECAFGALPIQRTEKTEALKIIKKAVASGINYFDTARGYTDSEEKLGEALHGNRHEVIISSKITGAMDYNTAMKHIETSLKLLKTDYIDLMQLHNPPLLPNEEFGPYLALKEAKKSGKIRHIGITYHPIKLANEAINIDLFETLQYPFSYLSSQIDIELVKKCKTANIGFIAMKALSGGMITDAKAAASFIRRFENVVPIWGIQKMEELDQFLEIYRHPNAPDNELDKFIEKEQETLSGSFCRACAYCMPCPVGIEINTIARLKPCMSRMPLEPFLTEDFQRKVVIASKCTNCGQCKTKCPYELDTPTLIKENLKYYKEFMKKAGIPIIPELLD